MQTKRGFTLLETLVMLVVLTVVTLLLAGVVKLQDRPQAEGQPSGVLDQKDR
jgi:type II secretory pathway pseudopilin PulG